MLRVKVNTRFTMGTSVSKLRKEVTVDDELKQEFVERLQILERMADFRLENEMTKILSGERTDQDIDTGTIVSVQKMVYIKTEIGQSEVVKDVIHQLFSSDRTGGLESVVELSAETVLGNDSAGEYESSDMFIIWSDNALLRCDTYYYRWNFVSKSVIKEVEGVTGCLLMKRVIDITKINPQVLTWAITRMANRLNDHRDNELEEKPEDIIYHVLEVLQNVVKVQRQIKGRETQY